jgi:hypothetical protein
LFFSALPASSSSPRLLSFPSLCLFSSSSFIFSPDLHNYASNIRKS